MYQDMFSCHGPAATERQATPASIEKIHSDLTFDQEEELVRFRLGPIVNDKDV
jgi:hypothetical protein